MQYAESGRDESAQIAGSVPSSTSGSVASAPHCTSDNEAITCKAPPPSGRCTPVIFERECHSVWTFHAVAEQREQDKERTDPVLTFSHRQQRRSGR